MEGKVSDIDNGILPVETSLFSLIKRGLDEKPSATVAIVTHQKADHLHDLKSTRIGNGSVSDGPLSWTYADMQNASLKLITGMEKQGVKAGSTITTFIPNGIEPLLFLWTSMLGKYTLTPLDPGATSTLRSAEARSMLEATVPDVLVVADEAAAANLDLILASLPKKPVLKIVLKSIGAPSPPSNWTDFLTVTSGDVDEPTEQRITLEAMNDDLDRTATIMFTSGTTTGRPKGCPRTIKNLLTSAITVEMRFGSGECRIPYVSQNFRVIAPTISTICWSHGHSMVVPGPGFSAPGLLDAIEKYNINWLLFVPFALHATVAHPMFQRIDLSRIETVAMGGDMITRDHFRKAVKAFPNADVYVAHGMTEGGGVFNWSVQGVTKEDKIPWYADIAPLGKVQKGVRLKIADEDNRAVLRNAIGELHISSNAFARRYTGGVKPEDFYIDQGTHWFKTGDTGLMNTDGWVFILGRKKDIIKRAGVPITPSALESALDVYLDSQTSVIAMPSETFGQEPFAVVRDLNGHSKEQVKKHIVDLFGREYALGGVATLEDLGLSNFPINQTEKIMKLDLQRIVAQII